MGYILTSDTVDWNIWLNFMIMSTKRIQVTQFIDLVTLEKVIAEVAISEIK